MEILEFLSTPAAWPRSEMLVFGGLLILNLALLSLWLVQRVTSPADRRSVYWPPICLLILGACIGVALSSLGLLNDFLAIVNYSRVELEIGRRQFVTFFFLGWGSGVAISGIVILLTKLTRVQKVVWILISLAFPLVVLLFIRSLECGRGDGTGAHSGSLGEGVLDRS